MKTIIPLAIALIAAAACRDDKGNYDYVTLDVVTIDTAGTGILPAYAIYRYDSLRLAPVVAVNGTRVETDPALEEILDYHWTIYSAVTSAGIASYIDTIGTRAALDTVITRPAGLWTILFTVTHRPTGIKTFARFPVQVDEIISDGWMVLYEKEGDTDAGLIVNDRVKKGVVRERLFLDLYSASNEGQRLAGPPVNILHSVAPLVTGEVLVASARDLVGVDKNSFSVTYPLEKLFWTPPVTRHVTYLGGNNTRREIVINNNQIHYANYMSAGTSRVNALGAACTGNHGQLAPWLSSYYSASFEAIAYDQTNRRFLQVAANGVTVDTLNSSDKTAFDVNNTGMEMVLSDFGRSNYEYTIARDANSHALLVSNFSTATATTARVAIAKHDMSDCPGISAVTSLAPGGLGEFIYYSAGDKLYLFKYNVTGADRLATAWTAPAGDVITCVRLQRTYYPAFAAAGILINNYSVIYIATWNDATDTGTVHQILVDPSNGAVDPATARVYTGFGRVKDMSWKWTM
ncbi:MAG: hypothetical protein LBF09_04040 [Odoribacteraceae bacterium]|nr:hypothetical protein [Odoribacteraceae bacterium]